MLNQIVSLNPILNKEIVAPDSVPNVVLDCQVMDAVNGGYSGERVVDGVAPDVGGGDVAGHMEVDAVSAHNLGLSAVCKLTVGDLSSEIFMIRAGQHQMRSVHFTDGVAVSHHFDISGQQTHLRPHLQQISVMVLNFRYMFVCKWSINSDGLTGDGCNGFSFGLPMLETSRRHHDLLADLPVNRLNNCDCACAWNDSGGEGGPSGESRFAVHAEVAVQTADTLISEQGLLLAVVPAVHDEGQFAQMRVFLSTGDEPSSVQSNEPGLDSQVHPIFEHQSTALNSNTLENGSVLVDHQSRAFGYVDEIVVDGRHVHAPSGAVAPFKNVEEVVLEEGVGVAESNGESVGLSVGAASGANRALNLSGRGSARNRTVHSVNSNNGGSNVESSASEGQQIPTADVAVPRTDSSDDRSGVLSVLNSSGKGLGVGSVMENHI